MKPLKSILAPLALMLAAAAPTQSAEHAAAQRIRADVEFLASDLLEGRDTGSRGHALAAAYVASEFRAMGLQPGGTGGSWYQQVPFRRASHEGAAQASIIIGNESVALNPGSDFSVRPSLTQQVRQIDAPIVFAGRGISDRSTGIDDYAGLDVRGKVVLVLEGAPPGLPSEVAAHLDWAKPAVAASKGAVALIEIAGTGRRPRNLLAFYGPPVVDWLGPAATARGETARIGAVAAVSRRTGERLFAAARRNLSQTIGAANASATVRSFEIPARLRLSDRMAWADFTSPQVIAILPGADPALKNEHVVLMGHLDHLGVEPASTPGEDAIYNGAIDNAAGIATLLEAARTFSASGRPPRRSILFLASTGEERGLRGADYFAANPPVPLQSIVAAVNLDMPLLLYQFTDVIAFGGEHSTMARDVAAAARSMGLAVSLDPMPDESLFVRSDHYPLVRRGIPSVFLMTGHANGGKKAWSDFLSTSYHRPNDDLSQPIRWDQGARFADLNYRIARTLADSDRRPLWYADDYFGETFAPAQPKARR